MKVARIPYLCPSIDPPVGSETLDSLSNDSLSKTSTVCVPGIVIIVGTCDSACGKVIGVGDDVNIVIDIVTSIRDMMIRSVMFRSSSVIDVVVVVALLVVVLLCLFPKQLVCKGSIYCS